MSNTFLTISMITREALMVLENNLKAAMTVRRDFDDKFGIAGAKIGDTLNIRKPPRYVGRTGQAMVIEGVTETSVPLVLSQQFGVDIEFSSKDLELSIDDFSKRILGPQVAAVANRIDHYVTGLYTSVPRFVGTPGTVPNTLLTYLQAGQGLDEEACPQDGQRSLIITPRMQVTIVNALTGLFQSASQIAQQYRSGRMGLAIGFDWMMDQNIRTHTIGTLGGTPITNGAGQTGSSLVADGATASITNYFREGDSITVASVNAVNPQNRESTGSLRQFVVTSNVDSDGSGNLTIPVSPDMTTSGAFQTINAAITDGAAILTFGHASSYASVQSAMGLAHHKEAFALGSADLPVPRGVDKAGRVSDDQLGFSMRMVQDYDIRNDQFPCRLDVLIGRVALYRELAVKVVGS